MTEGREIVVMRGALRKRSLPFGFKAEAKRRSLDIRRAAGLSDRDPLNCFDLALHLDIKVVRMSDLEPTGSTRHLAVVEPGALSAATVRRGDKVAIWLNDSHAKERQMSSLAHEIGHVVLGHTDAPPLNDSGCRDLHADVESAAEYFGAILLVTDAAALSVARAGTSLEDAAECYGVSQQLMRWRLNDSGARTRVQREHRHSRPARRGSA